MPETASFSTSISRAFQVMCYSREDINLNVPLWEVGLTLPPGDCVGARRRHPSGEVQGDRRPAPSERWFGNSPSGQPNYILLYLGYVRLRVRDVTERKRARRSLARAAKVSPRSTERID